MENVERRDTTSRSPLRRGTPRPVPWRSDPTPRPTGRLVAPLIQPATLHRMLTAHRPQSPSQGEAMTQLPIPVQVGSQPLDHWDHIEARQQQLGDDAAQHLRDKRRPSIAQPDLEWAALGFEPRWVGFDTADCAAALQPSAFSSQGAAEFDRFRQGAERRGETAVVISPIGETESDSRNLFSVFGPPVSSVSIGHTHTSIDGRPVGQGARVQVATNLCDADTQLALRLINHKPAPTWRTLSLEGSISESVHGRKEHPPTGTLLPIVETELGEPVVAVWISPDRVERRYVVPDETPWPLLLSWLLEQALPTFVPEAMRRSRRMLASDKDLMTRRERDAHSALATLDADYRARRTELKHQLDDAQANAVAIREGLLYGTGQQLVDAVTAVLESAGIEVVDLDEKLGNTSNADLLCTYAGSSRLVEVKSATGSAPERAYQDLLRHLREWSSLPGATPIDGGALVISHEIRTQPLERRPTPYARPEFLLAQTEPVISAMQLFAAWRDEDYQTIRHLLFGPSAEPPMVEATGQEHAAAADTETVSVGSKLRRWLGWR